MDAGKCFEGKSRRSVLEELPCIELNYFVSLSSTRILNEHFQEQRSSGFQFRRSELDISVRELRIAQAEAKWKQRFARIKAIRSALHAIVVESGQITDRFVERNWESP